MSNLQAPSGCGLCGGAWHPGPCTSYTTAQYTIPGGELCKICGLTYYSRSYGGPNVCPACDCGFTGASLVEAQRKEIEQLRALVREMLELADNWPGVAYTYDLESRAREALEPRDTKP